MLSIFAAALIFPGEAMAEDGKLSSGDTAWILTSTALVLFMTLPGLALFYGGLVRARNLLSVLMQCFAVACMMSVLWMVLVYSLAFGDGGSANAWIGGSGKAFLSGVGADTLLGTIPESVFFMFQMTFAIITPALIVGAYVERIKFSAVLWFSGIWLILVYAPVCHWIWGGGWLADLGVKDFAGGLVVHVTAGISALVIAKALGGRRGFPREITPPHHPGLTMIGAAMLWIGWFGFNAGSALAADASAGMAMAVTHISAATASIVWMGIEWVKHGKPSLVGIVTGMVAGLATITPGSGFVGPMGALVFGILAGFVCYWSVGFIKQKVRIDDSLDVFAVHGVGGALGILLTSFFGAEALGGMGLGDGITMGKQFGAQIVGLVAVAVWSLVISFILVKVIQKTTGLRVSEEDEIEGLDITSHGERIHLN
ncbi:MAG: ammonia channel protein [Rhodospirillaceae bacterium]|nr:ammonia channel protein [Rhodospirillaceae bacterium]